MGGGVSKVDNYVLRVDDGVPRKILVRKTKVEAAADKAVELHGRQKSLARMNSKIVDALADKATDKSKGIHKQRSVTSLDSRERPPQRLASQSMLNTMPSSSNLITQSAQLFRTSSVMRTTCNAGSVSQYSDTYPWLIKQAKLTGSSLSEYELGRVIGK